MAKHFYSAEETEKKFESLPQEIKNLLYSFEMTSIITKVGEKHGLHIDQMDTLNTETAQVMMGLQSTDEFIEILMEDLGIDEAKANAIAKDIDEMLFSRARAAMSKPSAMAATSVTSGSPPSEPVASTPPSSISSTTRPPLSEVLPKTGTPTPPTPAPAPSTPTPASTPLAPKLPEMHPADVLLTQKTVVTAPKQPQPTAPSSLMPSSSPASTNSAPVSTKPAPPKPESYKTDPYREPIN